MKRWLPILLILCLCGLLAAQTATQSTPSLGQQVDAALSAKDAQLAALQARLDSANAAVDSLQKQLSAAQAAPAASPAAIPPATQPATQPVLIPWASTAAQLAAAGPLVKLQPGNYEVQGTTMLAPNTKYDFTGVNFVATKPCTVFKFAGDNTITINGTFDSIWPRTQPKGMNPKVGVVAYVLSGRGHKIAYPTFKNIDGGFYFGIGCGDIDIIGAHATADIRADMFYCGGPAQDETQARGPVRVWGAQSDDSEQEHGLRDSTPGFTGGLWVNGTFKCTNNKEPLALRAARGQTFINCDIESTMGVYVGGSGTPSPGSEPANLVFSGVQVHGGGYYSIGINAHDITIDGGSVDIRADLVAPGMEPVPFVCNGGVKNVVYRNVTRNIYGTSGKPWYRNFSGQPDAQVITDGGGNQTVQKSVRKAL